MPLGKELPAVPRRVRTGLAHWPLPPLALWLALAMAPASAQEAASVRDAGAALARGNFDQAVALYSQALQDKTLPNDRRAILLSDRGVAYARLQNPREAIEDFNRAIQLFPEYAAIYNNRGNLLLWDDAPHVLRKVLRVERGLRLEDPVHGSNEIDEVRHCA